jgi:hypothetical protein
LAQRASVYNISNRNFNIIEKPMCANVRSLDILPILNVEIGLTSLTKAQTGLTNGQTSVTSATVSTSSDLVLRVDNSATDDLKHDKAHVDDRRKPIIDYLQGLNQNVDQKVWRFAFMFTLIDGELYHRIADDLLFKCLDSDQAKVTLSKVHEGICGTHQSAPKMKWLL